MSHSSIEDFDVLSRLGSGSYGVVFKVKRRTDEKTYVIKTVRIVDLSLKEQQSAINEVTILSQLQSPFVVHYFDSFISGESLHLVMEFCNKGDLQGLIKKAKEKEKECLPEDLTWDMGLQIILGLHYLHGKKVLHRDLKAANVFLMKDKDRSSAFFSVKIGDLGVAKLLETSTAFAQTIVGTPYYLSPELCTDQPYRDKSDCWALGVLLYECCTLRHPFEARNQCALIMKIIQAPVKPPACESVSDALSDLILWLLVKDPLKRPSTRELMSEDIVRRKMQEHGYDLPVDMADSTATTHYLTQRAPPVSSTAGSGVRALRRDISTSKLPPPPPPTLEETERGRGGDEAANRWRQERGPGGRSSGVRGGEVPDKVRGVPLATRDRGGGAGSSSDLSKGRRAAEGGVRGDRVRGAQRVQSDKARQRYQVKVPTATIPPSDSSSAPSSAPSSSSRGTTERERGARERAKDRSYNNNPLEETLIGSSIMYMAEGKDDSPHAMRYSYKAEDASEGKYGGGGGRDYKHSDLDSPTVVSHRVESAQSGFRNGAIATSNSQLDTSRSQYSAPYNANREVLRNNSRSDRTNDSAVTDIDGKTNNNNSSGNDDDNNDDTACDTNRTLSTALEGSYSSQGFRGLVKGDRPSTEYLQYYKDDFEADLDNYEEDEGEGEGDEDDDEGEYDDDSDMREYSTDNDATLMVGQTTSDKSKEGECESPVFQGMGDIVDDDGGRELSSDWKRGLSGGASEGPLTRFGEQERTLRRSLSLATALTKEAAIASTLHRDREKERSGKGEGGHGEDGGDEMWNNVWSSGVDSEADIHNGDTRGASVCSAVASMRSADIQGGMRYAPGGTYSEGDTEEDSYGRFVEEAAVTIKSLERTIDESRTIAISILGDELFSDVYDLCVIGMYSNTDKTLSMKKEEEVRHQLNLYSQLQSIGVAALELVAGIKTLIAKESTLNSIKERLKAMRGRK